jgi:hypothetical protein
MDSAFSNFALSNPRLIHRLKDFSNFFDVKMV